MKCYNHLRIDAVAPCEDCGKGLCKQCADRYSDVIICDSCNLKRIHSTRSAAICELSTFAISFAISAVGMYYLQFDSHFQVLNSIVAGLIIMCIVAGWRTLSAVTPRFFIILPGIGIFIYFAVKLAISASIGLIAAPYRILKSILTILKLRKAKKRIHFFSHPGIGALFFNKILKLEKNKAKFKVLSTFYICAIPLL